MSAPTEVRCERTELPREWCAHCKTPDEYTRQVMAEKRRRERVRRPSLLGKWFKASYGGQCSRCDAKYYAGEEIRADYPEGAGYISKVCHEGARARPERAE